MVEMQPVASSNFRGRGRDGAPLRLRLEHYMVPEPNSGCWLWIGAINDGGYGVLGYRGKTNRAHRLAYEEFVGPIPAGLTIDHLCRNRCCINLAHLEAVPIGENVRRGTALEVTIARQRAITHCPAGHLYDEANTKINSRGQRSCRRCNTESARKRRSKCQK